MSIIFGLHRPEGDSVQERDLVRLAHATDRYALDGTFVKASGRIGMGFQPHHTHQRSNLETQPVVTARGDMLALDGRLDNQADLRALLGIEDSETPDSLIVLASFERWGENCFSHLVGDWAVAFWWQRDRSLYLARDHAGTRTLYYEIAGDRLLWGTYLETFFADRRTRELDRAYATRYLAVQPLRDLTPYKGILAVTPAHYVKFQRNTLGRKPYWSPMIKDQIHYADDAEFGEHFLSLFTRSIERRTGSGAPILAELSGGMDSTSIVCVSDLVRSENAAEDMLDTVSYFDDTEPSWNERPFFTAVEEYRGKQGIHIDVSTKETSYYPPDARYLMPGADALSTNRENEFENFIQRRQYRVILSGTGGDELLGGPPDPMSELSDYAIRGQLRTLLRQSILWCLPSRTPLVQMLIRTARFSAALYPTPSRRPKRLPPWLHHNSHHLDTALDPEDLRGRSVGFLPSAIDNGLTWWNMLETLPHRYQRVVRRREYRYPYLDRDLVDFLLRVPMSQLLKPRRRRYMMRNALRGIVPDDVLERRRKAYVSRSPLVQFLRDRDRIISLLSSSQLTSAELIDGDSLQSELKRSGGQVVSALLPPLWRAVQLELWLKTNQSTNNSFQVLAA